MEGGDTGLGRDAYGPPGRERSHHAQGPDAPLSPDGVYPPPFPDDEEAEGTGAGRPAEDEDDYGQLLRRPGEIPPRQQRLREPANPPVPARPPGQFTPNLSPTLSPVHGGPANGGFPSRGPANGGPPNPGTGNGSAGNGGLPNGGPPHGGPNGEVPNGDYGSGRQYRLPNGRRIPGRADGFYPQPPGPASEARGRHHSPPPASPAEDSLDGNWRRASSAPGTPTPGPSTPGSPVPSGAPGGPQGYGAPGAKGVQGPHGGPGPHAAAGTHGGPGTYGAPGPHGVTWPAGNRRTVRRPRITCSRRASGTPGAAPGRGPPRGLRSAGRPRTAGSLWPRAVQRTGIIRSRRNA